MEAKTENGEKPKEKAVPDEFESPPDVGFDDVWGLEKQKERVRRSVVDSVVKVSENSFLPTVYVDGEPGCGKTLFGEAIAGEIASEHPDLSYWHADPGRGSWREEDGFADYLKDLFEKARDEAPSLILFEEGWTVLSSPEVLREHAEASRENKEATVTVLTSSETPRMRGDHVFLHDSLYVDVGAPTKERWQPMFEDRLREAFEDDGTAEESGVFDLDYDRLFEKGSWCPPSAFGSVCRRVLTRAEAEFDGRLSQDCVEETLEDVREEMDKSPLAHTLDEEDGERGGEKSFSVEETDTTYEEVGGLDDVIRRIEESLLVPRQYPELFEGSNLNTTDGILLYGPPGNGKTLLARAIANETDRAFLSVRGPELKNKWFGETERLVRRLFEEADKREPSIVFFDEFDAVAPSRENCTSCERGPVNMLLTEMDGLDDRGDVLFLAATNRPGALDEAVLRPGRIGETVEVPPPDREARREIFDVYLADLPTDDSVTAEWLADEVNDGTSGAEIESVCRRAVRNAVRGIDGGEAPKVGRSEFVSAVKEVTSLEGDRR